MFKLMAIGWNGILLLIISDVLVKCIVNKSYLKRRNVKNATSISLFIFINIVITIFVLLGKIK